MKHLPDELLATIFKHTIQDIYQLLELQLVCKKFYRLSNHASLWYYLFKTLYPTWSSRVPYSHHMHHLIDWKQHVLKLAEQKAYIESIHFNLNPLEMFDDGRLKEPFVSDIDHTNKGVVALATQPNQITFLNYPSYTILRRLTLQIDQLPRSWSCQIMGIQTVKIQGQKMRFCSVVVGQTATLDQEEDDEDIVNFDSEDDDIMQIWKTVLIYRLLDDGQTTLVANITMNRPQFLGRDVFFFTQIDDMQSWLDTLSTETERPHPFTVFMLAYGTIFPRYAGCGHVFQFDARADLVDQDPSKTIIIWDSSTRQLVKPQSTTHTITTYKPAQLISTVRLGIEVNCMIHLRQPTQLNHLICTGNFDNNDLTVYDWRFGLRVGVLSGTTPMDDISIAAGAVTFTTTTTTTANMTPTTIIAPNATTTTITTTANNHTMEQPWGFEATFAVPPPPSVTSAEEIIMYGPRLIVVGDCDDTFKIKIWDLSHLLQVQWHPFATHYHLGPPVLSEQDELDMPFIYPWWNRGSNQLKWIAAHQRQRDKRALPYSVTSDALLRTHILEAQVKYSAYNILNSLMYLLDENGLLKVMDIETGQFLTVIDAGSDGVDVNVLGTREIAVTGKQGILRGLIPI